MKQSKYGNLVKQGVIDPAKVVRSALQLCRDEVTYSPAQRLRDNMKLEAAYKRMARSVA